MRKQSKTAAILLTVVSSAIIIAGCSKGDSNNSKSLRLSHKVINVADKGSRTQFSVESDLKWKLELSPANTGWLEIDKTSGQGSKTVFVTAIQPALPNGAVRSADIIATAPDNSSVRPVKLLVLQHDTTIHK